jgi:glycosyltransferase involved in cell wall biosynthesis
MSKPKISLIIPAFNEEKYIRQTLEAALRHGHKHFHEIIVVDNNSSDKTAEIAGALPGIRIVKEPNKGLTKARQRGFIEASGDILAYIDADTLMPPKWAETILEQFANEESLVCLSGPYTYYDVPSWQRSLVWLYWRLVALPSYWAVGYMTVGGNFAIKKEVVNKMGGFDTTIEFYGEDTDIARRASKHGKVKFSPSHVMPTSGRRFHNQGFMRTGVIYMLNFLSEVVRKRPATSRYEDYR